MRGRLQRVKMRGFWRGRPGLPRSGDSPDAIPAFATAVPAAILAPMPTLEIKPTHKGDCLRQSILQKAFIGELS